MNLIAIAAMTILGLSLGFILGYAARFLKVETNPIVEEIEALLPGSQCGQCGYPGCAPAAAAIAHGEAAVTICPPGGRALAEELATKLNVTIDLSSVADATPMLAQVQEEICIGCARCPKVCPTDAIIGASKQIHSVIKDACTGCGQCIDVCPTEALQLYPIEETVRNWKWVKPLPALAV
ncbi:MAG: electron transport complex subunit RsxB [Pseudomonadota bacterium]|nr:electron transport complex subunit RsxB [Pseudomonadota bacterium]